MKHWICSGAVRPGELLSEWINKTPFSNWQEKMREVVKAVVYKDDKYLLQLRDNDPAIFYPNTWSFFGGDVDEGEYFEEALKRELEEELCWHPDEFQFLDKSIDEKVNCNITYYLARCDVSADKLMLGEGQAMGWFSSEEISGLSNTSNGIKNTINKAICHLK